MIRCKHCTRTTRSSIDVARVEGWRMFSGVTQSGKPLEDVVCPWCAGTAPEGDEPSWRVRCRTCGWYSDDDDDIDDEGALDAKNAKLLARDHNCDPQVEIAAPGTDTWLDPRMVNDDGSLRRPVATVTAGGGRL